MTSAWLIERDGTVQPCRVLRRSLFSTLLILDHQGNQRAVEAARVRSHDNIDVAHQAAAKDVTR